MKTNSFVIAIFLGNISATTLKQMQRSTPLDVDDGEDYSHPSSAQMDYIASGASDALNVQLTPLEIADNEDYSNPSVAQMDYISSMVDANPNATYLQTQSDMSWIELPDCGPVGTLNLAQPIFDQEIIPLDGDLHNSSIATCKSYIPGLKPPPPKKVAADGDAAGGATLGGTPEVKKVVIKPLIYDDVQHANEGLKLYDASHEHQVTQHMEGDVNPAPNAGPRGDFNYDGLLMAPAPQPVAEKKDATLDTLIQLKESWVELPNCTGSFLDTALNEGHTNAVFASCKKTEESQQKLWHDGDDEAWKVDQKIKTKSINNRPAEKQVVKVEEKKQEKKPEIKTEMKKPISKAQKDDKTKKEVKHEDTKKQAAPASSPWILKDIATMFSDD